MKNKPRYRYTKRFGGTTDSPSGTTANAPGTTANSQELPPAANASQAASPPASPPASSQGTTANAPPANSQEVPAANAPGTTQANAQGTTQVNAQGTTANSEELPTANAPGTTANAPGTTANAPGTTANAQGATPNSQEPKPLGPPPNAQEPKPLVPPASAQGSTSLVPSASAQGITPLVLPASAQGSPTASASPVLQNGTFIVGSALGSSSETRMIDGMIGCIEKCQGAAAAVGQPGVATALSEVVKAPQGTSDPLMCSQGISQNQNNQGQKTTGSTGNGNSIGTGASTVFSGTGNNGGPAKSSGHGIVNALAAKLGQIPAPAAAKKDENEKKDDCANIQDEKEKEECLKKQKPAEGCDGLPDGEKEACIANQKPAEGCDGLEGNAQAECLNRKSNPDENRESGQEPEPAPEEPVAAKEEAPPSQEEAPPASEPAPEEAPPAPAPASAPPPPAGGGMKIPYKGRFYKLRQSANATPFIASKQDGILSLNDVIQWHIKNT